jgi:large subunit ribosomal protein L23
MGLFSRTKKEETSVVAAPAATGAARVTDRDLASVIVRPRITEKAVGMSDRNVYTFVVRRDATKFDVRDAVKAQFGVTPEKIRIVNRAPAMRHSGSRNRAAHVPGMKKAYVYLKKGDNITLV